MKTSASVADRHWLMSTSSPKVKSARRFNVDMDRWPLAGAVDTTCGEIEAFRRGLTPVQYSALQGIENSPGVDQRTLARTIGFDTSTTASVIDRLESRGLVLRNAAPSDKRVRLLTLTDEGRALLAEVVPSMLRAQERMLDPLTRGTAPNSCA
ncbi:MarR family transcriptional regulator [Variovorax sp. GT1P44]|uniref:MarR family winged helix-turn-helix transcriptional regulator n=1 Tax=Variovorax sp. GT1P44 TaxID=3443742 RepID=UPI003F481B6E